MTLAPGRPTVLMYHGFSHGPRHDDPYALHVSTSDLDAQLGHLHDRGWQLLDLDGYLAVLDGGQPVRRGALLTIDDALCSVALAAPVLAARCAPSVLFVPPALLGGTTSWLPLQPDEPIMGPDQVRALQDQGMEMGVHGWDHASLAGMTDGELRRATREARDALADVTGRRPRAFAYPFGDVDARAVRAVQDAGFEVGFSVYRDAGRWALSRTDVKPRDSLTAVRVKLACGPRYRLVWRAVGRVGPARRLLRMSAQRA